MSENSEARVLIGEGESDKAKRMLTFWERRDTSVCGFRSFAKPVEKMRELYLCEVNEVYRKTTAHSWL